ncbi:MAG: hypothetical protein MR332_03905 [Fusicatenibacter sp.]|nr:hypothetical protein [Fusicatenibacter sp.]
MSGTITSKIEKINQVTKGWINYYAIGSMKTAMAETDAHLRTRLRNFRGSDLCLRLLTERERLNII